MEYKNINAVSMEIGNSIYLYDRFSNEFMKIDKAIEKILDDFFTLSVEEIEAKHTDITKSEIIEKIDFIKKAQSEHNVLIPYKVSHFAMSPNLSIYDKIKKKIESGLTNLILAATEECNLRCKYCIYSGAYPTIIRTHNSGYLSWETAKKAIDIF
ncbi:MAG: hypothetical protein LBH91_00800 [Prevotellaceae bacterium]|jgi:uncharacterized protein|nr:hypothetical protein [Prevotellaceae bacterium]